MVRVFVWLHFWARHIPWRFLLSQHFGSSGTQPWRNMARGQGKVPDPLCIDFSMRWPLRVLPRRATVVGTLEEHWDKMWEFKCEIPLRCVERFAETGWECWNRCLSTNIFRMENAFVHIMYLTCRDTVHARNNCNSWKKTSCVNLKDLKSTPIRPPPNSLPASS